MNLSSLITKKPSTFFVDGFLIKFTQHLLKTAHLLFRRLGKMPEREIHPQTVILDLTDLAKRQQLHLIHIGVGLDYAPQLSHLRFGIVDGRNDYLPKSSGNSLRIKIVQKGQRRGQTAPDVFAVGGLVGVFEQCEMLSRKKMERVVPSLHSLGVINNAA